MLSRSLEGVDREALYKAVKAMLKNQDGRARSSIGSVSRNLSAEDIKPLLPVIYQAIIEQSILSLLATPNLPFIAATGRATRRG